MCLGHASDDAVAGVAEGPEGGAERHHGGGEAEECLLHGLIRYLTWPTNL